MRRIIAAGRFIPRRPIDTKHAQILSNLQNNKVKITSPRPINLRPINLPTIGHEITLIKLHQEREQEKEKINEQERKEQERKEKEIKDEKDYQHFSSVMGSGLLGMVCLFTAGEDIGDPLSFLWMVIGAIVGYFLGPAVLPLVVIFAFFAFLFS
jgi:hypothetical protein